MAVNKELAATALPEAVYTTDRRACERFGMTERTLHHYRRRLNSDPELSAICRTKKAALDAADHERLRRLVKGHDDATLAELCRMVDLRELHACRLKIGLQLLPGERLRSETRKA